jgi:hypothetical protein
MVDTAVKWGVCNGRPERAAFEASNPLPSGYRKQSIGFLDAVAT